MVDARQVGIGIRYCCVGGGLQLCEVGVLIGDVVGEG